MVVDAMRLQLKQEIADIVIPIVEEKEQQTFRQHVVIPRNSLLRAIGVSRLNDEYQRLTQALKRPLTELVTEQLKCVMEERHYKEHWYGGSTGYAYEKWMKQEFLPL